MTLDEAIRRLELVRQLFCDGNREVTIEMAWEQPAGAVTVTLADRMTWARDRENETSVAMPHEGLEQASGG